MTTMASKGSSVIDAILIGAEKDDPTCRAVDVSTCPMVGNAVVVLRTGLVNSYSKARTGGA